jgi:hypothetical protein
MEQYCNYCSRDDATFVDQGRVARSDPSWRKINKKRCLLPAESGVSEQRAVATNSVCTERRLASDVTSRTTQGALWVVAEAYVVGFAPAKPRDRFTIGRDPAKGIELKSWRRALFGPFAVDPQQHSPLPTITFKPNCAFATLRKPASHHPFPLARAFGAFLFTSTLSTNPNATGFQETLNPTRQSQAP